MHLWPLKTKLLVILILTRLRHLLCHLSSNVRICSGTICEVLLDELMLKLLKLLKVNLSYAKVEDTKHWPMVRECGLATPIVVNDDVVTVLAHL